ncbi:hypothetical protein I0Q91_05770 [Halanaerobiaceae bacterium Z-7014]|uniref:protein-tyrosine-phosphatase n=1 Tax=Halonatronomonas betaini TaxID=2778430 RepID=A0A931AUU8_9FIRM|nr:CpsB/CapC family capsule biosynthesis tyrosine phosphatase [Halonatronomonas betaini]MBF8436576.1 hypothetical protein [Halonatronomonas betaini]
MIDLHAHVLPGIDDGPEREQDTIEILKESSEKGVKSIVATPHFNNNSTYNKDYLIKEINRFNKIARNEEIEITLFPGAEYQMNRNLSKEINDNGAITLANSSYLLVEFPFDSMPVDSFNIFHDLKLLGYKPVIAHPERCADLIKNPEKLYDFVDSGIYAQLNSGSILGRYGSRVKKTAEIFIKNNLVQLIGSDLHSTGKRNQLMPIAIKEIENISKEITINFSENAVRVISNKKLKLLNYREPSSSVFSLPKFIADIL